MADSHEALNRVRSDEDGAALCEQRCETCRFWRLRIGNGGQCHRFPPTRDRAGFAVWPETLFMDWCGEWWLRP